MTSPTSAPRRPALVLVLLVGILAVASLVGQLGCGQIRPCRTGTVFLTIRLSAADGIDRLSIDLAVNGASSLAPGELALAPGNRAGGGVEVDFPKGYPAGAEVVVVVTAWAGANPVGTRSARQTLAPSCSSLELDFTTDAGAGRDTPASDAGAGDGGDADGSDSDTARAATGGHAFGGSSSGGSPGGSAGTSGGGNGGLVGAGGSGGLAGAGSGGAAGAGTGAPGGGAGAAGAGGGSMGGGAGGAGGAGGGPCLPTGQEDCSDGIDNDCNGNVDCADDACSPITECVSVDPKLGPLGNSLVAGATCPAYAPTGKVLDGGLIAAGCTGCACTAGTAAIACSTTLSSFDTAADCGNPSAPGRAAAGTVDSTAPGCLVPDWAASSTGALFGFQMDPFQAKLSGACAPTGTPTKGTPIWTTGAKFCGIPRAGGGCPAGQACVPREVAAAGTCALLDGAQTCPAGLRQSVWYTGFVDGRSCGACSCSAPTGGDCNSMLIAVDGDSICRGVTGYLRSSSPRLCVAGPTGILSPGVAFSGTPVGPTCRAVAPMSGELTATGAQTLCCL